MLTKHETAILIDVLARTDALFGIPRVYSKPFASCLPPRPWAAVFERRAAFATDGVAVSFPGSAQQRKEAERRLAELQNRRLLTVHSKAGRRIGVRLTPRGDDVARHFAAAPLLCDGWPLLAKIARLVAAGASIGRSVRETDLAECDYNTPETNGALSGLELKILPLAAAGLVVDAADSIGRVCFALTPAGELAATQPPPEVPDLPPYPDDAGWWQVHNRMEDEYLAERLSWRPAKPGHIGIPMAVGIGPVKTWRDLETTAT